MSYDDTGGPPRPRRFPKLRFSIKLLTFILVIYFASALLIPGFRKAGGQLRDANPLLLLLGLGMEIVALYCYTLLTKAALGDGGGPISNWRLFRIQMSTKALSSIVPGGSAAGNALGYRLMTLSGVAGPDAGFALATAGIVSAVVLNLIFWVALIVSIPIRGVNPGYATAAVIGVVLLGLASVLVVGLLEGGRRAERIFRWIARKLRLNEDRAAVSVRHIGGRLEDLAGDRQLLVRVGGWAAANWLVDAAALWVFLRAFGASTDLDALLVAFGLANVLAVIPISPGGLGIIDGVLPLALVGFGLTRSQAQLGTVTWRLAQYLFPVLLGGILYATLRVGPWSIKRRDRLGKLREMATDEALIEERSLDFAVRFARRRKPDSSSINESSANHPAAHWPAEGDGFDDHQ